MQSSSGCYGCLTNWSVFMQGLVDILATLLITSGVVFM
jgi:hypothetical protein